jgi:hypothetical protein
MSEDRMIRIEGFLERVTAELTALRAEVVGVRGEMATKGELAALRAEMATKEDLATVRAETATMRAEMATMRAEMATKEDFAACAKNVDVTLLGRQMLELLAMKDDVTVLTAIAQRLDHTMTRQMNDVLTEVRAEHSRMDRLPSRVRALETAQPPGGS